MKLTRSLLLFFLPFIIFTYVSFIVFQKACDYGMHVQAEKPIPFNHKAHIADYGATDCEMCHGYYENGRFKGTPAVSDCRVCHEGTSEKEKALFKNFKDTDRPWGSFAKQPELVYFSHIAVMKNTKQARCASCHGDKAGSTNMERVQGKMHMGQCMDCHDALKISNTCMVCHD